MRDYLRDHIVVPFRACTVRGHHIRIGLSNPLEGFRISTYSTKEPETLDWIESTMSDGDILYDVGANIGLYSIYAAMAHPNSQVYAFEPESLNFTRLMRNIRANRLKNVFPVNIPICETTGFDFLYLSGVMAGSALHGFGDANRSPEKIKQGSLGISLDDLVFRYGLPQPHHIKIDVDNIEEAIIRGADKVIRAPLFKSLLVEITAPNPPQSAIHSYLYERGLELIAESKWEIKVGDETAKNFIYRKTRPRA